MAYDISDDSRLAATFKIMRAYGDSLQLSVFLCRLSRRELVLLVAELSETIDQADDSVLMINLGGGNTDSRIRFLGARKGTLDRRSLIF